MVKIVIKRENEIFFLYETKASVEVSVILKELVTIYNGILKILQLSSEVEGLGKHGVCRELDVQALDDNIAELSINDSDDHFTPSGGYIELSDPDGRRSGRAPKKEMAAILHKAVAEVRARVSENQAACDVCLSIAILQEALHILAGAVNVVYPNGLPTFDPLEQELKKIQTDVASCLTEVVSDDCIEKEKAELWWAGKKLEPQKKLSSYIGSNEKTKITAKIQKAGQGPPAREPTFTSEEQRQLMLQQFRRQEELKNLAEDDDNSYLDSEWADNHYLKKSFQGLKDVRWK